jgi:hypothetical protein
VKISTARADFWIVHNPKLQKSPCGFFFIMSIVALPGFAVNLTNSDANTYRTMRCFSVIHNDTDHQLSIYGNGDLMTKGLICASEMRVHLGQSQVCRVPDYVFESTYKLMPLNEVESYIRINKHLPEIPSAQEIAKNGLDVAEMNLLLLKKVEELTLYTIELKKEVEALKNQK